MIKLTYTEDTERQENREKCLDYLRKHQVDVGLTSTAQQGGHRRSRAGTAENRQ